MAAIERTKAAARQQQRDAGDETQTEPARAHATIFTMRSGTTMTFLGGLPASTRWIGSSASAACFGHGLVGAAREFDFPAPLAVDLNRDGDAVGAHQRGIGLGPGGFDHQCIMAQRLPAGFCQMRHHRPGQQHDRLQRLAARGAVDIGLGAADGIGQRIDLRHGAIEPQGFQILGHRGDGAMGGAAQFERIALDGARFGAGRRQTLGLDDQTVDALHETPAAFRAFFGPFDIALGRGVGEHEPADRVGAEILDDRFRRDHVLLATSTSSPTGRSSPRCRCP